MSNDLVNNENMQEKAHDKRNEDKRNNREKVAKKIAVVLFIFGIVLIGILASTNDDFSVKKSLLIGLSVFVITLIIFFWFKIGELFSGKDDDEKDKIPAPRPIEEIKKLAQSLVVNKEYCDMIPYPDKHQVLTIGDNPPTDIFYYYVHRSIIKRIPYAIVINMHYPEKKLAVLPKPKKGEITYAINRIAMKRETPADKEEIESENPLTGTRTKVVRKTYSKNRTKSDSDKKGDLQ